MFEYFLEYLLFLEYFIKSFNLLQLLKFLSHNSHAGCVKAGVGAYKNHSNLADINISLKIGKIEILAYADLCNKYNDLYTLNLIYTIIYNLYYNNYIKKLQKWEEAETK